MQKISRLRLVALISIFSTMFFAEQQTLADGTQVSSSSAKITLAQQAESAFAAKNYPKAFILYKQAESTDVSGWSDFRIAYMYMNGEGVKKDLASAIYTYRIALKNITNETLRAYVINDIGIAYVGLNNYVMGFKCYREAAMMGDPEAQLNLAYDYGMGQGIIQDYKKSYAWLSVAISQGAGDRQIAAKKIQDALANKLGWEPGQLEQAQALAKQYYKRYVLHETPQTKNPRTIGNRVYSAIAWFENPNKKSST